VAAASGALVVTSSSGVEGPRWRRLQGRSSSSAAGAASGALGGGASRRDEELRREGELEAECPCTLAGQDGAQRLCGWALVLIEDRVSQCGADGLCGAMECCRAKKRCGRFLFRLVSGRDI